MQMTLRFLISAALAAIAPQLAASEATLHFILDASGSMWGRVGGQMKIVEAKSAMSRLVRQMPDKLDAGLTLYGHRRKGDCADIEVVIQPGNLDRDRFVAQVERVTPRGKTPIAASLAESATLLRDRAGARSIVLVSDGLESCGRDPCALANDLREADPDLVIHTVGFDADDKTAAQLACIARAGGGQYFSAGGADQLLATLTELQSAVTEHRAPVVVEIPPQADEQQVVTASKSIRIKARGPGTIRFKRAEWVREPHYWRLVDPETGEMKGEFRGLGPQLVAAGEYQLLWRQTQHGSEEMLLSEVVSVRSGKSAEVSLLTGIELRLPSWVKPPHYWGLRAPGSDHRIASFAATDRQLAPAGTYEFVWRQSQHGASETVLAPVLLEPDRLNVVTHAAAINPQRAEWLPAETYQWGLRDPRSGDWVARFGGTLEPQLVPAGRFEFVYRETEHETAEVSLGIIEVADGKAKDVAMNTGVTLIPQKGMSPPYRVDFVALGADGGETARYRMGGRFGPMLLKPGPYRIDYQQEQHGATMMTIVDAFELPPGALVEIEL